MSAILDALKQHYGFDHFRPGQESLVQAAIDGQDALGILPTGSGKTLCYQLPTLMLGGTTIVIEPLLALMEDQVKRLQAMGEKHVIALTSQLQPSDFRFVLAHLNGYRFVFMAPEMLARQDVIAQLQQMPLTLAVVDEAHCISQWGPDFRPAYLKLGDQLAKLNVRATMALTATAPKVVQDDIKRGLHLNRPQESIASVNRPNVFMGLEQVDSQADKMTRLIELLTQIAGPKIIYFDSKQKAEQVTELIAAKTSLSVAYYHAGLDAHTRDLIYRRFMQDQLEVICATSAFGMGIDKPDVRLVVHLYVPESLEAYSQAIGRAGRDGEASAAVLLIGPGDYQRAAQFSQGLPDAKLIETIYRHPAAYQNMEDPQIQLIEAYIASGFNQDQVKAQLRNRLSEKTASFQAMATLLNTQGCLRQALLAHFDSPLVAHTAQCCGELTQDVISRLAPAKPVLAAAVLPWQTIFTTIFKHSLAEKSN
ncbi:RecQ family ATP-dependent DNA helicase [Lacticaseibacillus saniviri]